MKDTIYTPAAAASISGAYLQVPVASIAGVIAANRARVVRLPGCAPHDRHITA
jgi:hypothetical protein